MPDSTAIHGSAATGARSDSEKQDREGFLLRNCRDSGTEIILSITMTTTIITMIANEKVNIQNDLWPRPDLIQAQRLM